MYLFHPFCLFVYDFAYSFSLGNSTLSFLQNSQLFFIVQHLGLDISLLRKTVSIVIVTSSLIEDHVKLLLSTNKRVNANRFFLALFNSS